MDWKGIELVIPIYELSILLVTIFGFIVFQRRVKQRELTKTRGFLYYSGLTISPVVIYIVFFFVLVGLEEVINTAILPEGLGRSFLILIGFGIIIWLISLIIFGVVLAFVSSSTLSPNQANTTDAKKRRG